MDALGRVSLGLAVAGIALGLTTAAFPAVQTSVVPNSTPTGITLVDVTSALGGGGGGGGIAELYYRRFGDTDGKPLYTFDQDGTGGKSTCVAACAKEFPLIWLPRRRWHSAPGRLSVASTEPGSGLIRAALSIVTPASIRFPRALRRAGNVVADGKPEALLDISESR